VSVTLSDVFLSVISGTTPHASAARRRPVVQGDYGQIPPLSGPLLRCVVYRRTFSLTEIALPALALRNSAVAKWVRDQNLAVDVRSSEDLGVSLAAGIHPARLTIHADALSANEILFCAANLGVNRLVVTSTDQVDLLASRAPRRRQGVLVAMTDRNAVADGAAGEADDAVGVILDRGRLDLIGLHCEIGARERDFISYPAAIGHMISAMAHIRDEHDIVLSALALGGGRAVPPGDWAVQLPKLASEIDESLDDACATLRFPRPMVAISAGLAILGQEAA
jgi:diaminopimelate decarboxylase